MKKIFKALALALAGAMFMVACDDTPAPYNPNPGGGEGGKDTTVVTEKKITCAEAAELCGKLTDGSQSAETYVITGYITDVFANISNNQQSFWMADTKDGGKVIQAFWANLPEGVKKFTAGSKVAITGRLLKYVKTDGTVVAEVKNPTVVIMEQGGGDETGAEGTKVTCAKAVELCNALAAGESSAEAYSITGYITDVFANTSNNQQSFWMADTKDGGKVIQAFWANLPEGVKKFTAGSKVAITGRLLKYVKTDGTVVAEVKNPTVVIMEQGGGDETGTEGTKVTCAKAVELCNALAAGESSAEAYSITGYITDVFANISNNQQSFWLADTKDGGKMIQAYWANLPEGVEAFTVGSKVTITGKLLKYVKTDGTVVPEVKNPTVTIIETGGSTPGGEEKPGEVTEFSIDLAYTLGTNAYDNGLATINGVEDCKTLKIGTAKAAGTFTLTMPAGKHTFYAVAWKGTASADVTFSNGDAAVKTVKVKGNTGATGNAPYTISVTDADKYEIELAQDATITVTSDKRIIFFGIK